MFISENSFFSLALLRADEADAEAFALRGDPLHTTNLSLAGRQAAGALFLRYYQARFQGDAPDVPAVDFIKKGKPVLPDFPDFHYSISHSGEWAAAASSGLGPIGVDIQKISRFDARVMKKCFAADDIALLEEAEETEKDALFTRLWTEYEAVLKVFGGGLLSLSKDTYADARDNVTLFHPDAPEEYALCVAIGMPQT